MEELPTQEDTRSGDGLQQEAMAAGPGGAQGMQDTIDLDNIEHMFPDAAEVGEVEAEHNNMQLGELRMIRAMVELKRRQPSLQPWKNMSNQKGEGQAWEQQRQTQMIRVKTKTSGVRADDWWGSA